MPARGPAAAALLVAVAGLAGCAGGSPSPPPASAATSDSTSAAAPASTAASTSASTSDSTPAGSATGAPSPSAVATLPADRCLSGRYSLVRFVAVGGSTYGTGQGGDVTVTFGDDRYTLSGAGVKPMVVTVGGQTGNLTVDGRSTGTYALKGSTARFAARTATGGATLGGAAGGATQKVTMKQVDGVIGLTGAGQVACTGQAMTITLKDVRLELGRV